MKLLIEALDMSDTNLVEFAAVITVTLPGNGDMTDIEVVLTSNDSLIDADGVLKPLGDCTLGDLKRFAEKLEDDIWSEYWATTLFDLVVDGQAVISVQDMTESGEDRAQPDLLLEHLVILPPEEPDDSERLDGEAQSEEPVQEIDEELQEIDLELQDGDELQKVSVAESQLVFEERDAEAPAEVGVPLTREEKLAFRILGKRRPLNHPTWTAVDILINEPAFRDAQAHAVSTPGREVAGVLVGPPPEKQPDGRYVVHISDAIIAKHTRMHGASVTYTPESWRYVNDKLAELYPNEEAVIVGWYHTHPGFGIFLSGMDRFIHQNFFTQIWHIALVLDPHGRRSGFFCWDRGKAEIDNYEFPWPLWASSSW